MNLLINYPKCLVVSRIRRILQYFQQTILEANPAIYFNYLITEGRLHLLNLLGFDILISTHIILHSFARNNLRGNVLTHLSQSTIDSEGFKGGTRGAPIMPRDAVSRTANVDLLAERLRLSA